MTEHTPHNLSDRLDDYLDGRMDDAARLAFETALQQNPQLRAELECQRLMDASMRRMFTAVIPSAEEMLRLETHAGSNGQAPATAARSTQQGRPGRFQAIATMELKLRHVAMIAAVVVLTAWLGWRFWPSAGPPPVRYGGGGYSYAPSPPTTPVAYYRAQIASGFKPAWACPPDRFAQVTGQQLGESLTYDASMPPQVAMAGVSYANILSPKTVVMLGRVDGQPVMVFIDRAATDPAPSPPTDSGLHLYRRQAGALVLYELTPVDEARMLPLFIPSDE